MKHQTLLIALLIVIALGSGIGVCLLYTSLPVSLKPEPGGSTEDGQ